MNDKYVNSDGLTRFWNKVKSYVSSITSKKADLVSAPTANDILISDENGQPIGSGTDMASLLFDVDAGRNAFRLYDFTQNLNVTLPSITTDVANTSIPNVDIIISDEMGATWAIAALAKYEFYNGSTRINAAPVCAFTMNGQKTMRLRMMAAGPSPVTMTKVTGAILLKRR